MKCTISPTPFLFFQEQTILCDKCDQEYHTFCLGLPGIPDEGFVCPACIDDEKRQKILAQRRKEREARKKIEDEKRKVEEEKKRIQQAKRKEAYAKRKKEEAERKQIQQEKRKIAYEKRKKKEAEMRAQGIPVGRQKSMSPASILTRKKRGPGRPSKSEMQARMQAQQLLMEQQRAAAAGQQGKRGRGRPRADGSDPVPRQYASEYEISADNLYLDTEDLNVERSRSGRKIQRTTFHDEMEGGGLMKRPRLDSKGEAVAAAKGAWGGKAMAGGKKEPKRKAGAREAMQVARKLGTTVIDPGYFDTLMDYSTRGRVDHLIRMRERMDEHSRFLESQLAGLEELVKRKGEWKGTVQASSKSETV